MTAAAFATTDLCDAHEDRLRDARLLVLFRPQVGGLSIVALIAGWAIVTGVLKFVFGMNLRKFPQQI